MPKDKTQDGYQLNLFEDFNGVTLLQKFGRVTTRLVRESSDEYQRVQVSCPADVAAFLHEYFRDKDREEFLIILLNTANVVEDMAVVSVGGLAASIVEPRQVFKTAVLANAAAIIGAHNHPSGNPEPSREDIRITRQLVEAGKLMGIPLHDHIIIAGTNYTSLAERGLMP